MESDRTTGEVWVHFTPESAAGEPAGKPQPELEQEGRSIAAKVLELLSALKPGKHCRKAAPIDVFLLYFRQNLSWRQIARECDCSRTLVAERLRSIRKSLPWQPQRLREVSAHVEAMQEALSDSRARKIYRKGAVYGGEEEEENLE